MQTFPPLSQQVAQLSRGYGAAALSPFVEEYDNTEQMLNSPNLFQSQSDPRQSQRRERQQAWDGLGLPGTKPTARGPDSLWRKMQQLDLEESGDDFASPMSQTPLTLSGRDDHDWVRQSSLPPLVKPGRSILKPPSFLPPVPSSVQVTSPEQQERRIGFVPLAQQSMPDSYFSTAHDGMEQYWNNQRPEGRTSQTEEVTRVTWASTPHRRMDSLERKKRRLAEQLEGDEEPSSFTPFPPHREERGDGASQWQSEGNQVQMTRVLQLLTEKLMDKQTDRPQSHAAVKLPQMTLPTPSKRSTTGEVTAKSFFLWKAQLAHSIKNHRLDPEAILLLYSTNDKLLPSEWQTILSSSSTLQEAVQGLDKLYPPLCSIHPEIVKSMVSLPALSSPTEKTKVFRISSLLKSLEQLLKLFGNDPSRDITRQEAMMIIYNLSSSSESRAELVNEICAMDRARHAGVLYAQSLREYLIRTRMILTDVIAAIQLVGRPEVEGKFKSAAAQMRIKEREEKKEIKCLLCSESSPVHRTFDCKSQLALLRAGKRTLPPHICKICLQNKEPQHPKDCGQRRIQRGGVYQILSFKCVKGCGVNNRLCSCNAGPSITVDPDQTPGPKIKSAATMVVEVGQMGEGAREEGVHMGVEGEVRTEVEDERVLVQSAAARPLAADEEEGDTIFQAENVFLQGKDMQTLKAVASFDTHGSSTFISGTIPPNFNWSDDNEERSFEIDTIHGKAFTRHQVLKIKILTLKGAVPVNAIKGSWINPKEETLLDPDFAERFGLAQTELEDNEGNPLPRVIIGCSLLNKLHPRYIPPPAGLADLQPDLACYRSRLSQSTLCAGRLLRRPGASQ